MPEGPKDSFTIYFRTLQTALLDKVITAEESAILKVVRDKLSVSPQDHITARTLLAKGRTAPPGDRFITQEEAHDLYRECIKAALEDAKVTRDEWALLNILRLSLWIDEAHHQTILAELRGPMTDEEKRARLEQLRDFLQALGGRKTLEL